MAEFSLIDRYFKPLVTAPGADRLRDDVATLSGDGANTIITTDALVEGTHFLPTDPLDTVAYKLIAVNVSDVRSKGAVAAEALLTLVWPSSRPIDEVSPFADGLGQALDEFGVSLIGGDTVSTDGPFVCSLTLTGRCIGDRPVRRTGAQIGDDVWVSGPIGRGLLGLEAARGDSVTTPKSTQALALLIDYYRKPRITSQRVATLIAQVATASLDVSDGLVADAQHIAVSSDVGIRIDGDTVPVCATGRMRIARDGKNALIALITGGDDYQSLFTAPQRARSKLENLGELTRIGSVMSSDGMALVEVFYHGELLSIETAGWQHPVGT